MLPRKLTSVDMLKSDYPEIYAEAMASSNQTVVELTAKVTAATAQVTELTTKLSALTAENEKNARHQKIRDNGARLGLPTYAETLVKEDKSLEEALTMMIEKGSKEGPEKNELLTVFKETGSAPAGQSSLGDTEVPKTYEEMKTLMSAKNPDLKGPALARAARRALTEAAEAGKGA